MMTLPQTSVRVYVSPIWHDFTKLSRTDLQIFQTTTTTTSTANQLGSLLLNKVARYDTTNNYHSLLHLMIQF